MRRDLRRGCGCGGGRARADQFEDADREAIALRNHFAARDQAAVDHDVERLVGQPVEFDQAVLPQRQDLAQGQVLAPEFDRQANVDFLDQAVAIEWHGHGLLVLRKRGVMDFERDAIVERTHGSVGDGDVRNAQRHGAVNRDGQDGAHLQRDDA